MDCEKFSNQFTDYLTGSLEAAALQDCERHLALCESCRGEAEAVRLVWAGLDALPVPAPDSYAMRARFEAMVEAYRQGTSEGRGVPWWTANTWIGTWWPKQPVVQLGVVLLLLAGGVVTGQYLRLGSQQQAELNQLRGELGDMRQMVVLSLMRQPSASERLRGVSWSYRIDQPGNEVLSALLDTLRYDPNVNVRLAAVDALKHFGESGIVRRGALQALTAEDSPLIQSALIDFMVETGETESVDALRAFAGDMTVNESVRLRAAWGLEQFE